MTKREQQLKDYIAEGSAVEPLVDRNDVFDAISDGGLHRVEVSTTGAVDRVCEMLRSKGVME